MAINLADNNPRVVYTVAESASQSVFAVPFEFFEDADVKVYVDGTLKAEGTDYTLTGGDGATGSLTFGSPVVGATGGSEVVLFRRIAIERTTDFQQGMEISRAALNAQLDTLTALVADMNDRWDRAVHISDFDTGQVNFILPASSVRAGNYFAFDENGDPVMTAGTTSDIIVSTFGQSLVSKDNATEVFTVLGVTSTADELNLLDGVTWALSDYNTLTATAAELNQLDGVTLGSAASVDVIDEDDMVSNSATRPPSQQSVKAYVDSSSSFIASVDASNSAAIDFTQFDSSLYDAYEFVLMNIVPSDDGANFFFRTSSDGGSTYDASTDYSYAGTYSAAGQAQAALAQAVGSSSSSEEHGWSGTVRVMGPHLIQRTLMKVDGGFFNSTSAGLVNVNLIAARTSAASVNAIRFFFSAGDIESGTISMYGLRNS